MRYLLEAEGAGRFVCYDQCEDVCQVCYRAAAKPCACGRIAHHHYCGPGPRDCDDRVTAIGRGHGSCDMAKVIECVCGGMAKASDSMRDIYILCRSVNTQRALL